MKKICMAQITRFLSLPLGRFGGALALILLLQSCNIQMEKDICLYNMELTYWYNEENTSTANKINGVVNSITQYLFDENEVLVDVSKVEKTGSANGFVSRKLLPAGKYSLISWGNVGNGSTHNQPQIGVTTKSNMELYFSKLTNGGAYHNNSERLYYARRTFSVGEYGIGHMRVDVLNAHCIVNVKATWTRNAPATNNFVLRMNGIPSRYTFRTEHSSLNGTGSSSLHDTNKDNYLTSSSQVFHYIPKVYESTGLIAHEVSGTMS